MEKTLLENLKACLKAYSSRFLKAVLLITFANFLLIFNPLIFREALINLSDQKAENPNFISKIFYFIFGNQIFSLWPWALVLLLISLISAYCKYSMRIGFITISREMETEVRRKIFIRIQEQSRAFFDRHGIGELLSYLTNDVHAYRELIGPGIMYPLFCITLVLPGIVALFYISTPLALLSLVPIILIPLIHGSLRRYVYYYSQRVHESLASLSNFSQEHFSGIRIVKSYGVEKNVLEQFSKLCKTFSVLGFRLSSLQGLMFPFFTTLTRATTVLLVLLAGFIMLNGWELLTGPDFISFMWIQSYIFFPILMLSWVLPVYERGKAAYQRIVDLYEEPIQVHDNPKSILHISPKADIECKNLTFRYQNSSHNALNNLNVHIKGGSFVGITGPTGAGKTTLLQILNREYEVPTGTVFIGSHEIHEYSLKAFRSGMVTVEQASFLFSKSVAENVAFGTEEASQEEIESVSRFADLHETIMDFPQQYETVVGERGVTLSGGQRQRVAIARAFLVNRSILLLDDIFSAVDSVTEKKIFEAIKKNFSGRSVIMVTHRLSILNQMDQIIYMREGKVEETGTFEELKKKKGALFALMELQQLESS